jgi:hypothetical protein
MIHKARLQPRVLAADDVKDDDRVGLDERADVEHGRQDRMLADDDGRHEVGRGRVDPTQVSRLKEGESEAENA